MTSDEHLPAARILIVDDQLTHRLKTLHAVQALGHSAETADSGASALARLKEHRFDLVLLDILMPDMDGYEVMQFMQNDQGLADIPVIVVSALESEMKAVVRAVEMGADDVLPKHFDAVLLSARLDSALQRRTSRLREQLTREHMSTLMAAASKVELNGTRPEMLRLESIWSRPSAVGQLARVFVQMTGEVQSRDRQLQKQLDGFRTLALASVAGIVLGLGAALASSVSVATDNVANLATVVSIASALICLSTLLWRRPQEPLVHLLRLGAALAVLSGLLGLLPLLWLSTQLPASVVAGVLPLELAAALVLRTALSHEKLHSNETLAIGLCVIGGICLIVMPTGSTVPWSAAMGIAAVLPAIGFAATAHYLSATGSLPADASTATTSDTLAIVGIAATLFTLVLLPYVLVHGEANELLALVQRPGPLISATALSIVMLAVVLVTGVTLRMLLAHQSSVVAVAVSMLCVMLATPAWTALLLSQQPSPWIAVPLVIYALAAFVCTFSDGSNAKTFVKQIDLELA